MLVEPEMAPEPKISQAQCLYRPLLSSTCTRLMILQPGERDADIVCDLHDIDVGEEPSVDYTALSYVWGDPGIRSNITVNQLSLPITVNLKAALRRLRPDTGQSPLYLWVDAVCINQDDLEERVQQLHLMRDIFSGAATVVAWLGEAAHEGDALASMIQRLPAHLPFTNPLAILAANLEAFERLKKRGIVCTMAALIFEPTSERKYREEVEDRNLTIYDALTKVTGSLEREFAFLPTANEFSALLSLLGRPYFRRMWIVQEIAVNRRLFVQFGCHSINWDAMVAAAFSCPQIIAGFTPQDIWLPLLSLVDLRDLLRSGRDPKLLDLAAIFTGSLASDPRDKLYALLGLADNTVIIEPHYNKPWRAFYEESTLAFLASQQHLGPLSTSHRVRNKRALDLPSWVIDWSNCITLTSNLVWLTSVKEGRETVYCTVNASRSSQMPQIQVTEQHELVLRGHTFDIVGAVADEFSEECFASDTQGILEVFEKMSDFMDAPTAELIDNWSVNILSSDSTPWAPVLVQNIHKAFAVMLKWFLLADLGDTGDEPYATIPEQTRKEAFIRTLWFDGMVMEHDQALAAIEKWCASMQSKEVLQFLQLEQQISESDQSFLDRILDLSVMDTLEVLGNESREIFAPSTGRRLTITKQGMFALLPEEAQTGDHLMILEGGDFPFVMRRLPGDGEERWKMVGDAYVYGVMHGEAYEESRCRTVLVA